MASGSYLAGVGANKILANPASFIGSIGVIMQGADLSGLANKLGIKEQTIQAGELKVLELLQELGMRMKNFYRV